jgi:repressor LexA
MQKVLKKKDKQGLTPKQKVVFDVIKSFIDQNGVAPSYEELKQLIGSKSKSHVHGFIHQLMHRGWIGKGNGRNRSIYIL